MLLSSGWVDKDRERLMALWRKGLYEEDCGQQTPDYLGEDWTNGCCPVRTPSLGPLARWRLTTRSLLRGHRVPASKLKVIAETIPKVAVIVGDMDELIEPQRGHELHEMLPVRSRLEEGGSKSGRLTCGSSAGVRL